MGIFSPQGSSVEQDQLSVMEDMREQLDELNERISMIRPGVYV